MNTENNRQIDELIGNVLEDNVPADVDRRLRSQLEEFRHRLGDENTPAVCRSMALGRRVWLGVSAAAAAAIAVAAMIWWSLVPSVSLADVAAAVLQQPWIHVIGTGPNGETNEFWYSPIKDISAWHDKDWIEYRDHRVRIYYAYDLHDKVLYRVPEEMRRGMEHFGSMIASLQVLLQSKEPVDKPLERLGLSGIEPTQYEVVKQVFEKVKQDDREWLDYHLTLTIHEPNKTPQPIEVQMLFRVDPETKLLQLSRDESQCDGRITTREARFDYPEKGPADVYDLGVPKTAKLVDRVPTDDLARILETIRAGRQRMDDYRAILVRRMEGEWRPSGCPEVSCRKGDKFRRDTAIWTDPSIMADPKINWPEGGKDAGDWWRKCIEDHCFLSPMSISCGSTEYNIETHWVTDPDGSPHAEITGVRNYNHNMRPGDLLPMDWSMRPEFACRPPLGIPHETMEAVLEPNPKEGPAGTILLRVRRVGPKEPPQKDWEGKPLPLQDNWRNWLDPNHDYAVVRSDIMGGNESVASTVIDKMARSPQGTWYATRIRNKGGVRIPSEGKVYDQMIDIYVDFNANLPDSLFEPPKPGRIY